MGSEVSAVGRLQVLVVDDHPRWRQRLTEILQALEIDVEGVQTRVDAAEDEIEAGRKIAARAYDLAVVDLALLGDPPDPKEADEQGFELLREIRANPLQRGCGVIVITGTATSERIHRALQEFDVKKVVLKPEFEAEEGSEARLLTLAREAILDARVRGAAVRRATRCYLTMIYGMDGWVESELQSPGGVARDLIHPPAPFNARELIRRADNINRFLAQSTADASWRPEMRDIGGSLYQSVAGVPTLYDKWAAARPLAREKGDLWLRFRGPADGLGIPFDLMRDEEGELCLRHILSRELLRSGFTPNLPPFSEVIASLRDRGRSLRALLVASNSDGTIPAVEEEVEVLDEELKAGLGRIGLGCETTLLPSEEASYSRVLEELRGGRYHLFHYAGHGRYQDDRPEASGPILPHGAGVRALTADDLSLVAGSDLQLVFLSCCLGAVDKNNIGTESFCRIVEELAKAGVPTVLGYRWIVADDPALELASTFYAHLWRTLCPGEAALEARRETMREWGRDDQTWAAPVLLVQSP